jgi:flagellar biosynthesis protein FlhA
VTQHGAWRGRRCVYQTVGRRWARFANPGAHRFSLCALLVSKGGTRGAAEKVVINQLVNYPRAVSIAALLMFILGTMPELPMFPFVVLGGTLAFVGYAVPKQLAKERNRQAVLAAEAELQARQDSRDSVKECMKSPDIELCLGKQLAAKLLASHSELAASAAQICRGQMSGSPPSV